ncbi:MAG: hypothetical protein ACFFEK_17285, partial [Candidatus Thorarchaeota archaeon]
MTKKRFVLFTSTILVLLFSVSFDNADQDRRIRRTKTPILKNIQASKDNLRTRDNLQRYASGEILVK